MSFNVQTIPALQAIPTPPSLAKPKTFDIDAEKYLFAQRDVFTQMNTIISVLNPVAAAVMQHSQAVAESLSTVQTLASQVSTHKNTVVSKASEVEAARAEVASNRQTVASYKTTVQSLKNSTQTLANQVATNKNTVVSKAGEVETARAEVAGNRQTVATDKATVQSLKSTTQTLANQTATNKNTVVSKAEDVEAARAEVASNQQTVANDKATVQSLKSTTQTLANQVATNKNTVVTKAGEVETARAEVASNKQTVASDKATVQSLKNATQSLANQVSDDKTIVTNKTAQVVTNTQAVLDKAAQVESDRERAETAADSIDQEVFRTNTLRYDRSYNLSAGTDLNEITTGGFYDGSHLLNAPSDSTEWFYVVVQRHTNANGYCMQHAYRLSNNASGEIFYRLQTGGDWGEWIKIFNSANDGDGSGLNAEKINGLKAVQLLRSDTTNPGNTALQDLTVHGKLFLEGGKHSINHNDGSGNFNIKVGVTADPSLTSTEDGYSSHWTFWQDSGEWSFRTSVAKVVRNDPAQLRDVMKLNKDGQLWSLGGFDGDLRGNADSASHANTADSSTNASKLAGRSLSDSTTANTVAGRNAQGDIYARLFRSTYQNDSQISSTDAIAFRRNASDNYTRFTNNKQSIRDWADIYSKSQVDDKISESATPSVTKKTVFTASGTFSKDPNSKFVLVKCWGGGGGGAVSPSYGRGCGGSGGAYSERLFLASDLNASEQVVVGAGGLGGNYSSKDGSHGNDSRFKGFEVLAHGGNGGKSSHTQVAWGGGLPGYSPTIGHRTGYVTITSQYDDNANAMNSMSAHLYHGGRGGNGFIQEYGYLPRAGGGGSSVYGGAGGASSWRSEIIGASSIYGGKGGSAGAENEVHPDREGKPRGGGGGGYNGTIDPLADRGDLAGNGGRGEVEILEW